MKGFDGQRVLTVVSWALDPGLLDSFFFALTLSFLISDPHIF